MLQAIREKAQGWIAWAIVILISIPFALWGIQEYLGVGSEPEVAIVDGTKITQRMLDERTREFRENLRLSLGDNYRADIFEETVLKQQVRDTMVEEMVLVKSAEDWNLRASDMQARGLIASIPAFQRDGRFDQQAYDTAVRNRGMSRAGFEQNLRRDMVLAQLRSGVRDTAFATQAELDARVRLADEKRTLAYARVPAGEFSEQVSFTQDELRDYYQANLDRYRTPERVKLSYLLLDATQVGGSVDVTEEALRQYFQDHKNEFVAREERALRHILVAVAAGAAEGDVQKAEEKARAVLEQVRAGADFASLAKENSDDPGSSGDGGDLGWVEPGMMVPAFEEAAFALAKGAVSELVRTDFGFHIVQVTDIRGGAEAGFDDMRDKVELAYRKFEAESLYFDHAERLAEFAYENSASLTPAAEALGLMIQSTDWVTRDSVLPEPLNSPRVMNAAFSHDVLAEGHNSELIEVDQQQAVVLRIAEHKPAGVKPFDDNVAAIEQDFRREKASDAAARAGAEALAQLEAGGNTLEQIASEHGWQLKQPGAVGRHAPGVPAEILSKAFGLALPDGPRHVGVVSADGDYMLIAVLSAERGQFASLSDEEKTSLKGRFEGQISDAQLRYFTRSLRDRADVELKPIE